ncbi:hypothetical protein T4A_7350 [Trichinella pseudospiralis]|uniref:Uncharacterized protein n=1 Tax=Trichinella pseudospiralis TaxID=6337 RepID=A0A0V1ELH1_TRIPS|nr:hypothetical protein T4A_7350 [Trichinella pseudospiralis]
MIHLGYASEVNEVNFLPFSNPPFASPFLIFFHPFEKCLHLIGLTSSSLLSPSLLAGCNWVRRADDSPKCRVYFIQSDVLAMLDTSLSRNNYLSTN